MQVYVYTMLELCDPYSHAHSPVKQSKVSKMTTDSLTGTPAVYLQPLDQITITPRPLARPLLLLLPPLFSQPPLPAVSQSIPPSRFLLRESPPPMPILVRIFDIMGSGAGTGVGVVYRVRFGGFQC